jgi:hypothetical protein
MVCKGASECRHVCTLSVKAGKAAAAEMDDGAGMGLGLAGIELARVGRKRLGVTLGAGEVAEVEARWFFIEMEFMLDGGEVRRSRLAV